jgi:heme exporter protein B
LLLLIKTSIHLLIILIPILIILPLVLIAYDLNIAQIWVLFITIVLGSPALVFIGSICASITVGLSRGGILLVILALPLYIPILILSCASFLYFVDGHSIKAQLALLLASSIIAVLIAPFLSASVLKSGLQCGS